MDDRETELAAYLFYEYEKRKRELQEEGKKAYRRGFTEAYGLFNQMPEDILIEGNTKAQFFNNIRRSYTELYLQKQESKHE